MEYERNTAEDESILGSIDESSTDDDYDGGYISTNVLEDIRDGNHIHPDINARDYILKIHDPIKQAQSECKGVEISAKVIGKGLHKLFKAVVN